MSAPWVAIVGCGGLGVPAAWALAMTARVSLRLIDPDVVEESNLHRQVLYRERHVGQPKVEVLAEALRRHTRGDLKVEAIERRLTPASCDDLLRGAAAVVEGTDDAFSKFVINDALVRARDASRAGPTLGVIAAAIGRGGQWFTVTAQSSCYRCLFEEPPPAHSLQTCETAGVLGPVVGVVGGAAARSVWTHLGGKTDAATGALIRWREGRWARTEVPPAPDCTCDSDVMC